MSSRSLLTGAVLLACLGLTGCTGRQILAMRQHPEKAPVITAPPAAVRPPTFTGPALAATTDYPRNPNAPRPEPPAAFASLKSPVTATAANLAQGKTIFTANCAVCHGAGGAGDGPGGASLNPKPANFHSPIHGKLPDGYWFWRVTKGGSVPPFNAAGSAMPPWETVLTPQQRWLVILYEHTFSQSK